MQEFPLLLLTPIGNNFAFVDSPPRRYGPQP
jgi:hypothetical protein